MRDLFVIGVGNRDRGDDAVGPLVVDALRDRWGFRAIAVDGDLSDLALRWPLDDHVVIVDAAVTGAPPGTIHVVDGCGDAVVSDDVTWSTHGIGLGDAIALARVLGRLPAALTVIGVEAAQFDHLARPTPAVAAAVTRVVEAVELARPAPRSRTVAA
jgi:hydrogenase maturation protease